MPTLTKSNFLKYLQCPRYLWLWEHRKAEIQKPISLGDAWTIEEGQAVEVLAQKLFPEGRHVTAFHERGAQMTKEEMDRGATCLFQATALADGMLAMTDVLRYDPKRKVWDILEVKGTTQVKDEHLHDVCFQRLAFERAGYRIGKTSVVHINREYVRGKEIDPTGFLTIEDVTEPVSGIASDVSGLIVSAKALLARTTEPTLQELPCRRGPKDCPCAEFCYPDLPAYSVFFLRGVTAKKARELYVSGIRTVRDVPDTVRLNTSQTLQVHSAKTGEPIIDREAIKTTLDGLTYPLYFFDYETFSSTIPPFEGFKPNVTMPFQYSLHVLRSPGGELEHEEYLASEYGNTMPGVIASLRKHFGNTGTVIAWNDSFERGCNKEMADLYPADAPFLMDLNDRMFDLMDIFTKQHYVDFRFDGSCSIKKVLPVVVPELSYKDLPIHEGIGASLSWFRSFEKTEAEREEIRLNLLKYCKLDTFAMVEIHRRLSEIASSPSL